MMSRAKQVSFILFMALLLTSLFTGTVYAQCPGTRIYFNEATGNDQTGDGKSDATAFKTAERAMQAAAACTTAVTIYKNNQPYRPIPAPLPEGTGLPIAESLLIGGLILLAILLIGGALLLRRRPAVATS